MLLDGSDRGIIAALGWRGWVWTPVEMVTETDELRVLVVRGVSPARHEGAFIFADLETGAESALVVNDQCVPLVAPGVGN